MENNREIERYAGLIAFIIGQHHLAPPAAATVSRRVWWRFTEHHTEDDTPAWLATTTHQECERLLNTNPEAQATTTTRERLPNTDTDALAATAAREHLLDSGADALVVTAIRRQALRDAVATLTAAERRLLTAPNSPARAAVLGKLRNALTTSQSHY